MDTFRQGVRVNNDLTRELLAEFFATGFLVLVGCGSMAQSILSNGTVNAPINVNLCWGFAIAFGIYIAQHISGGHINPAVSTMFWSLGKLTSIRLLFYILAQTAGAFVGAAVVYMTYFDALNKFDGGVRSIDGKNATVQIFIPFPSPYLTTFGGIIDGIVATAIFCGSIATIVDSRNKIPAPMQPLLIGFVVVMVGSSYGMNAGGTINPARDLGPRIFTWCIGYGWKVFSFNNYTWFWIPIVAPLIGSLVGAWLYKLFIGFHWPKEGIRNLGNGRKRKEDDILLTDRPREFSNIAS
uniref:Uncharacterized protein n=1 Tax=Plectus sambesii TaxID=2011161 RepID=A0A914VJS4_9BILA